MGHRILKSFIAAVAASMLLAPPSQGADAMSQEQVRQGYLKHAALAQFYRWYQFYENSESSLENQIDILAPDISLKSGLGEGKGHDDYRARVKQIPASWKNAHHIHSTKVSVLPGGEIDLSAEITYLNDGMKPGVVRSAELTYTTRLKSGGALLPKFTSIAIAQNSETTAPAFKDAYPQNRLASLMHYWLALIEDPARNLEPFREILADRFVLNFSGGKITDFAGFEKWFRGPASAVAASTHVVSNVRQEAAGANQYKFSADFDWQGILPDGKEMIAKTRHSWLVADNPKERFARIKTIDVEVLAPFAPKPKS
jgi:hypothetical protein